MGNKPIDWKSTNYALTCLYNSCTAGKRQLISYWSHYGIYFWHSSYCFNLL